MKDILGVIEPTDPNSFPIYIHKLTFDIFCRFLNSRKKTINVQIEGTDEFQEVQGYLSKSMYDGMRSALMHLHRLMGMQIDSNFQKLLSQYVKGLGKVVAERKKQTGQKLSEGKRPMSRDVYCLMCELMMKGVADEYLFAHCFLCLEWNLMARADNIASAMVSHIEWCGDSLVFFFAKTKTSQEGEDSHKP